MKNSIRFFHPDETLEYHIDKAICKVVFQAKRNTLLIEIHSTEDLDHVAEDSIQNQTPKIALFVEDFAVAVEKDESLAGKTFELAEGEETVIDEFEEENIIYLTTLSANDEDYTLNENKFNFSKSENGKIHLVWEAMVPDFCGDTDEDISMKLECEV